MKALLLLLLDFLIKQKARAVNQRKETMVNSKKHMPGKLKLST